MEELAKRIDEIAGQINDAANRIGIEEILLEIKELETKSQVPNFWQDNSKARDQMKRLNDLQKRVGPWQEMQKSAQELKELHSLGDPKLEAEIAQQLSDLTNRFNKQKAELKLSGPYDDHGSIISIHAGAGGTDAQDWAQMLLRMYTRYCEKSGLKARLIDQSSGEEAGIKSATLDIEGDFAYGKLKGEHGVHRLVRLSPYNADNLRQTSFAKVEVLPKIEQDDEISIDEKDLKVDVFRAGGHGGQSVNTTDSAVRVTHLPTGIVISIQNERSQLQNKETALTMLRSRLAQLKLEQHQEKIAELKGPNQSAEWGNQIRSYVLHPYKQVKDLRSKYETSDPDEVLDGSLDDLIDAYLENNNSEH